MRIGDRLEQVGTGQPEKKDGDERRMSPIVRGNPLPMWIYDRKTMRFLEVSEGAVRQYGYTREEFLGMTMRELRPTVVLLDGQDIAVRGRRHGRLWTHV